MNYLSLFSGAGGGDLACQHLLGWTCAGYIEIDEYCQKVLKQRIADGLLNRAPTFGDIRAFLYEGHAEAISGLVDVITAGFPCQPFSVAGQRRGGDDPRNMWPATIEAVRQIRPRFVFRERLLKKKLVEQALEMTLGATRKEARKVLAEMVEKKQLTARSGESNSIIYFLPGSEVD